MPASLDGKERNWLIVRAAKEHAAGPARRYVPMLARPARRVPSGPDWAFEIAWEGARAIAPIEGARARFERDGARRAGRALEQAARSPATRPAHQRVRARRGRLRVRRGRPAESRLLDGETGSLVYVVFDLLELERRHCVDEPWSADATGSRRCSTTSAGELLLSRAYDDGRELRTAARARGLGIVAKHRQAAYRPGAVSDDWRVLAP